MPSLHSNRLSLHMIAVAAAAGLLAGCMPPTMIHNIHDVAPDIEDLPDVAPMPAHVGIYYSDHFAGESRSRASGLRVAIGAHSITMLNPLFSRKFARTTWLHELSAKAIADAGVDFAIAPSIEHFMFTELLDRDSDLWGIAYRFTVYNRRAEPIWSWVVRGNDPGGFMLGSRATIRNDMADAARKFLLEFDRAAATELAAMRRDPPPEVASDDYWRVEHMATRADFARLPPELAAALRSIGAEGVRLTIRNRSGRELIIRSSDTRLLLDTDAGMEPSSASAVLDRLEAGAEGDAQMVAGMLGILGVLGDASAREGQREGQTAVLTDLLFGERRIAPGAVAAGIVFFGATDTLLNSTDRKLSLWLIDPAVSAGKKIAVPLKGYPTAVRTASRPARAAASIDLNALGPPGAGTRWTYQFRDVMHGRRNVQFSIRALRVDGAQVEEELVFDMGKPSQARTIDTLERRIIERELGGNTSVIEPPPYLFKPGESTISPEPRMFSGYPLVPGMPPWVIEMRVQDWEELSLPAGSYRALRVEILGRGQWQYFGHSDQPGSFRIRAWYAPEARRYVRVEHESWSTGPNILPLAHEVVELVSYAHR